MIPLIFCNSSVDKMLWKGTIPKFESPFDSIQVSLFVDSALPLFPFIMTEFSGGGNIKDQSYSAINGLVHVSQLRFDLVHWKPVLDAHNVLWILIYLWLSFMFSLTWHNYCELQKEKIPEQSLALALRNEYNLRQTIYLSKDFWMKRKLQISAKTLTLFFE